MNNEDRLAKPWWYPVVTDEKWCAGIRSDYPEETQGMSDENIHEDYAHGRKYAVTWDHIGDAYEEYEKLADAFLAAHEASRAEGLEWSKTLCDGKSVDYETAEAACKALGEGWRLPTRMELESILDLTRHDPAVDTERFPDTKSEWYWTSTPCAWASSCAWIVGFSGGGAYYSSRHSKACVRAVRSLPGHEADTASKGEVSDAEIDARLDRQYIAGAKAGYNLGESGDREGFNRMIDARNDHILAARKEKNDE